MYKGTRLNDFLFRRFLLGGVAVEGLLVPLSIIKTVVGIGPRDCGVMTLESANDWIVN